MQPDSKTLAASTLPFRPGREPGQQSPLARYLPRPPLGAGGAWLAASLPPGSWVVDPFGASPQLAVEAARSGYRVLVAANNPIARFLIEMAASPPAAGVLNAALAELAGARRSGEEPERMEPHLRNLYQTECPECGRVIEARAFLWEKDANAPYARYTDCPHCGKRGESPASAEDIQRAGRFAVAGPHRARALARVAPAGDPDRAHAEEALDAYLPRAVYALFTLINRLSSLPLAPEARRSLSALLLAACDRGSTLWPVGGRARPRQLAVPPRFYEHNLWWALEEAIPLWATGEDPVPLALWPDHPPASGGICLYEGRMKNLAEELGALPLAGGLSALPRPNQAFWTLSALWAGWLWGQPAVGPFISVVRRRRYDWAWHTGALEDTLRHLVPHLPDAAPFLGLVTESELGMDLAALLAAERAGLRLAGSALRPGRGQSQYLWQAGEPPQGTQTPGGNPEAVRRAALETLRQRGQPSQYLHLQAAAIGALAANRTLALAAMDAAEQFSETRSTLEFGLTFQRGFLRFDGSESSLEAGRWWPRQPSASEAPLADRMERWLVARLLAEPGQDLPALDAALCAAFPGTLTPPADTLAAMLDSYAEVDEKSGWRLRPADAPAARRADLEELRRLLVQMGQTLGYQTHTGEQQVRWQTDSPPGDWHFQLAASAVLGERLLQPPDARQRFLVHPGSRARLLLHKLKRDARLAQRVEQDGWQFLTFRLVRRLAQTPNLTRAAFANLLELDPLSEQATQLPLL